MASFSLGKLRVSSNRGVLYGDKKLLSGGAGGNPLAASVDFLSRAANLKEGTVDYWLEKAGLNPNDPFGRHLGDFSAGGGGYGGGGGFMFEMPEFMPIEALPPIDVNAIVEDIGRINSGKFDANLEQSFGAARGVTQGLFEDFNTFVDSVLPGARDLIGSASREVLNFINKGMPSAVQNNAILRDAGDMGAGGIAGDIAIRRSLYNEAQRDMAAVQYGIGQAQSLVDSARNVGMQFAQIEAQNTQAFLGQLNSLTMISPGQAVGFAFDERNYQTGVAQFNATGMYNASAAGAQLGLGYAQLEQQNAQFQQQLALQQQAQRDAEKAAKYGAIGTIVGGGIGALLAVPTGGMSIAMGAGLGAQLGGGIGQAIGGNYAGAQQGIMGGLGTYAGYQTGMEQIALQRQSLEQSRRAMEADLEFRRSMTSTLGGGSPGTGGYYPGISSAPWAPYTPGPTMQGYGNYSGVPLGSNNFPYR